MAAPEPLDCGATRPFPVLSLLGVSYTLLKTSLRVLNTQNNCGYLIVTPAAALDLVDMTCRHVTASHSIDPAVCLYTRAVWIQHRHQRHQTHRGQTNYSPISL